ncbi:hypothetical protein Fmac_011549 [Flemingia macrophylla]|uniref:Uncharacterized protein n=1 Tax=Flemingia macrophylla TaxID=520843 RepID=A0ABD1MMR5_9FABA
MRENVQLEVRVEMQTQYAQYLQMMQQTLMAQMEQMMRFFNHHASISNYSMQEVPPHISTREFVVAPSLDGLAVVRGSHFLWERKREKGKMNAMDDGCRRREVLESEMRKVCVRERNGEKGCICSPSIHPLAFRCSNHRRSPKRERKNRNYSSASDVFLLKMAIRNSLLMKGGKMGEFAENMVITEKTPSHHQTRRQAFRIPPSPLSLLSDAHDL